MVERILSGRAAGSLCTAAASGQAHGSAKLLACNTQLFSPKSVIIREPGMLQQRKASRPASVAFRTRAIEKASCVDPGPGSALPRESRSAKRDGEIHLNSWTNFLLMVRRASRQRQAGQAASTCSHSPKDHNMHAWACYTSRLMSVFLHVYVCQLENPLTAERCDAQVPVLLPRLLEARREAA